jgi:hypothetical protein
MAEGWHFYRFDWPRTIFFTFFLAAPRGVVRLPLGAAFLRAARFSFFRSSLSSILVVSATNNLFQFCIFCVFPPNAVRVFKDIRVFALRESRSSSGTESFGQLSFRFSPRLTQITHGMALRV